MYLSMPRRTGWLLPAAAALTAAWIAVPAAVPLYDGIGFPDEPYRFVAPPAGYRTTPPPTRAFGTAPGGVPAEAPDGRGASTRDLNVKSAEQGPQVEIHVASGGLAGPAAARSYQISADPVAPGTSGSAPARIDGDVYRVKITCSARRPGAAGPTPGAGCPVTVIPRASNRLAWIALRATSARRPPPVFLYRPTPGARWTSLPTDRAGNDIYSTTLRGSGDYALTFLADGAAGGRPAASSSGGRTTTIIVLVGVLACLTVTVGVIRFVRTRG
jgi:hypothetical protein